MRIPLLANQAIFSRNMRRGLTSRQFLQQLWDREEVIAQIKYRHSRSQDISYVGVLEEFPHLLFAAVHYFKNWGVAVTSAGIDYSKVRREKVWSKKRIIRLLKRYRKKGESFRYNEFERKHPKLFHAACYHLGSWKNALSVIGIDYRKVKKFTDWNREKIKRKIKSLHRKGFDLSYGAMRRNGYTSLVTAGCFYFNNWGKAIIASGLPYADIRRKRVGCFTRP